MKRILALALLGLALLTGCGIEFSSAKVTDDFFTGLDVTGDMRAGARISMNLQYQQKYPMTVYMQCELRQGKELVKVIGTAQAPEHPQGSPDAEPFPGNFIFDFVVDQPGQYRVECLTPDDEDNYIIEKITIAPPAEVAPTPTLGAAELGQ